jgi:hypothetical protein
MGWFGQGHNSQGIFVQGMQHPRIFGRGHIGRGRLNIAPPDDLTMLTAYFLLLSKRPKKAGNAFMRKILTISVQTKHS